MQVLTDSSGKDANLDGMCVCVCGMRATPPVGLRMCLGSHPPHVVTDTVVVG